MAAKTEVREPVSQIEEEIIQAIRKQANLEVEVEKFAEEVRDHWRSISPVHTGAYAASIHVENRPPVDGLPSRRVIAGDFKSRWIEYGTGPDTKQGAPYGPDTPTPEFAPARKTAALYGGTIG